MKNETALNAWDDSLVWINRSDCKIDYQARKFGMLRHAFLLPEKYFGVKLNRSNDVNPEKRTWARVNPNNGEHRLGASKASAI